MLYSFNMNELLRKLVTQLPPSALTPEVRETFSLINEQLERDMFFKQKILEAVSDLKVDVKYLLFDLEATRRERDTLQEKLDSI